MTRSMGVAKEIKGTIVEHINKCDGSKRITERWH